MKKAIIFLTDGFEEMEALVTADILRRAGVRVELASITGKLEVIGSHDIKIIADSVFTGDASADMLILPGGPGASAFIDYKALTDTLTTHYNRGGFIAAICAAPVTLGKLGLLKDKAATCYPGMMDELNAELCCAEMVVTDGNITTARGPGASAIFGLALVEILVGAEEMLRVKDAMVLY